MRIHDITGIRELYSSADIETQLKVRSKEGLNVFWLHHGASSYPAVMICANHDLAYIHYFPNDHPGFQSVGPAPGLDPHGLTVLIFRPSGREKEAMPNSTIVPFFWAVAVAKEFARSPKLPHCMEWSEL